MVSKALVEMISKKCDLSDLLQLSVGKNLDSYLGTFCEIKDLNQSFTMWLEKKNKRTSQNITFKANTKTEPLNTAKPSNVVDPSSKPESPTKKSP